MAFNSYTMIKTRIDETYDTIYNGWYTNCTQVASAYNILLCQL